MENSDIALVFGAIKQNNIEIVKLFLENGANPNIQKNNGCTPLHIACIHGSFEIVKLLLEYGADPNIQANDGSTPLNVKSVRYHYDYFEIVKLLLEYGADPNTQTKKGWTQLMFASLETNCDVIMLLIDHGANCDLINSNGKTAFDYESGDFIKEYLESQEQQIVLK